MIGSAPALNSSRNFLSVTGSPRGSGSLIADPLRKTATDFAYDARQSASVISSPAGVSQAMSAPGAGPGREGAVEEPAAAEHRVAAAQPGQLLGEGEQVPLAGRAGPVHPGDLVVLAVGVVVAALGAADLVAGQQHRDALRAGTA